MKTFAPDYFKNFKCSAGNCRHSCCIGWEIDIDEETAENYKNVSGEFGEKLRQNIDFSENGGVFRLCENDRCPFLNQKGLCEIYINLGEDSLSQVCSDHPRFRNFFESRTEIGLGLCCEEAARLILEKKSKTEIIEISDDGLPFSPDFDEEAFFKSREEIFLSLQNRSESILERIDKAFSKIGAKAFEIDFKSYAEAFLKLERLDEKWTEILENIKNNPAPPKISDENAAEQLLCYFVFRHYCLDFPTLSLAFSVLCFYMTEKAAEQVGLFEAARLFSAEIEYSDENKDLILDKIYAEEVFF